jgi:hypothetical protein
MPPLARNQPQAGILFAGIDFDHSLILHEINLAFPGITLIASTTKGEISSVLEYQQDSLTLILFCASKIEITASISRDVSACAFYTYGEIASLTSKRRNAFS